MARKNRRTNPESERFTPSKELQEFLFGNKKNANDYKYNPKNRKTNSNYKQSFSR